MTLKCRIAENHSQTPEQKGRQGLLAVAVCTAMLAGLPFYAEAGETSGSQYSNGAAVKANNDDQGLKTRPMTLPIASEVYKASELIGAEVKDAQGKSIGEIKDLALVTANGRVSYAVLSFGGFMGVGDKLFAIPLNAFTGGEKHDYVVLNISEQQLDNAQGFDADHWPADASISLPIKGGDSVNANTNTVTSGAIVKASDYIGRDVKNLKGDELGEVSNLVIDMRSGKINYAVIDHGGVLGVGDKLLAVPMSSLATGVAGNEVVLNASDEELDAAKGLPDDDWPVMANSLPGQTMSDAGGSGVSGSGTAGNAIGGERFGEIDRDGNGYVNRSEASQIPALGQRYESLDGNRDGQLDRAEFARFETVQQGSDDR